VKVANLAITNASPAWPVVISPLIDLCGGFVVRQEQREASYVAVRAVGIVRADGHLELLLRRLEQQLLRRISRLVQVGTSGGSFGAPLQPADQRLSEFAIFLEKLATRYAAHRRSLS
jgi:hypothetical protein